MKEENKHNSVQDLYKIYQLMQHNGWMKDLENIGREFWQDLNIFRN